MPCGGIYPIDVPEWLMQSDMGCWVCQEKDEKPYSFCEEWDCYLHDDCVDEFLKSPEGEIVTSHNHEVERRVL